MSTKRKSTPIRLRKKTTRGVMLDLTAKYAEAVTKLAALEQRVSEHIEESAHEDSKVLDRLHALEVWRHTQHPHPSATPAPAEERGETRPTYEAMWHDWKVATEAAAKSEHELVRVREAMGAYPDSDLVSLATTLKANSDALAEALADAAKWKAAAERAEAESALRAKRLSDLAASRLALIEDANKHESALNAALADAAKWKGEAERVKVLDGAAIHRLLAERGHEVERLKADAATARGECERLRALRDLEHECAKCGASLSDTPDCYDVPHCIDHTPDEDENEKWLERHAALSSSPPPATTCPQHPEQKLLDGGWCPLDSDRPGYTPPQPSPEKGQGECKTCFGTKAILVASTDAMGVKCSRSYPCPDCKGEVKP